MILLLLSLLLLLLLFFYYCYYTIVRCRYESLENFHECHRSHLSNFVINFERLKSTASEWLPSKQYNHASTETFPQNIISSRNENRPLRSGHRVKIYIEFRIDTLWKWNIGIIFFWNYSKWYLNRSQNRFALRDKKVEAPVRSSIKDNVARYWLNI